MDTITAPYRDLAARLTALADDVDATRWGDPSPCDGWSAADVMDHLIATQRDFLTSHGVELGSPPPVVEDPAGAWRTHATDVAEALARPDVADMTFDGFFGPTTVGEAMGRFYGFDMIVHRWDIAQAAGLTTTFSPEELDQVETSIDGFGEHLYGEGICRPPVAIEPSATRQDRLLARMGRDPR